MKKVLLLFFISSILNSQVSQAQISTGSFELTSDDTLMLEADNFAVLESHASVKNISNQAVKTIVSREILNTSTGHSNYFCWGVNCYGPMTSESPDTISIAAGETNISFKGYLDGGGVDGVSTVRYCFSNADVSSDRACYVVKYALGTASAASGFSKEPGQPTQVPATYDPSSQTIKVNVAGGKIEVWNMLGQKVELDFRYDGTGMVADASKLKTGYYFLFGNNEKGPWGAKVLVTK